MNPPTTAAPPNPETAERKHRTRSRANPGGVTPEQLRRLDRAIAGAKGNADARIFSTAMEAQLLSIAGVYRTTDVALPTDVVGQPAMVRLDGDCLRVEPLRWRP